MTMLPGQLPPKPDRPGDPEFEGVIEPSKREIHAEGALISLEIIIFLLVVAVFFSFLLQSIWPAIIAIALSAFLAFVVRRVYRRIKRWHR